MVRALEKFVVNSSDRLPIETWAPEPEVEYYFKANEQPKTRPRYIAATDQAIRVQQPPAIDTASSLTAAFAQLQVLSRPKQSDSNSTALQTSCVEVTGTRSNVLYNQTVLKHRGSDKILAENLVALRSSAASHTASESHNAVPDPEIWRSRTQTVPRSRACREQKTMNISSILPEAVQYEPSIAPRRLGNRSIDRIERRSTVPCRGTSEIRMLSMAPSELPVASQPRATYELASSPPNSRKQISLNHGSRPVISTGYATRFSSASELETTPQNRQNLLPVSHSTPSFNRGFTAGSWSLLPQQENVKRFRSTPQGRAFCDTARRLQTSSGIDDWQSFFIPQHNSTSAQCRTCAREFAIRGFQVNISGTKWEVDARFLAKCHMPDPDRGSASFSCVLCDRTRFFRTRNEFWAHLESHSERELHIEADIHRM